MSEPGPRVVRLAEIRPLDTARMQDGARAALGDLLKDLAHCQADTELACQLIETIFGAVARGLTGQVADPN